MSVSYLLRSSLSQLSVQLAQISICQLLTIDTLIQLQDATAGRSIATHWRTMQQRCLQKTHSSSSRPGPCQLLPRACGPPGRPGRRQCSVPRAASNSGDAFADIKRVAKKIQGSLPIVGLLSRLSAPGGGFDEISYPEFCRAAFDGAGPGVRDAVVELEQRYGKLGQSRWLYLMLWMAKHGVGLVPGKNIILAAKRLRVTQDVEIEVDRFEGVRDAALQKFKMMGRPKAKPGEAADLAVDALATLCLGLADGQPVPEGDEAMLVAILGYVFPESSAEELAASIRGRPGRVSAYS